MGLRAFQVHILEVIVRITGFFERAGFLVFGDFTFEEVLLFFEIDGFGEPWERVLDVSSVEGLEAAVDETTIRDVINVLLELRNAEADGADWEAVADEFFLEADSFGHGLTEFFLELWSHDFGIFRDEGVEEVTEDLDVI